MTKEGQGNGDGVLILIYGYLRLLRFKLKVQQQEEAWKKTEDDTVSTDGLIRSSASCFLRALFLTLDHFFSLSFSRSRPLTHTARQEASPSVTVVF
jgi:hypothetical protein